MQAEEALLPLKITKAALNATRNYSFAYA